MNINQITDLRKSGFYPQSHLSVHTHDDSVECPFCDEYLLITMDGGDCIMAQGWTEMHCNTCNELLVVDLDDGNLIPRKP